MTNSKLILEKQQNEEKYFTNKKNLDQINWMFKKISELTIIIAMSTPCRRKLHVSNLPKGNTLTTQFNPTYPIYNDNPLYSYQVVPKKVKWMQSDLIKYCWVKIKSWQSLIPLDQLASKSRETHLETEHLQGYSQGSSYNPVYLLFDLLTWCIVACSIF